MRTTLGLPLFVFVVLKEVGYDSSRPMSMWRDRARPLPLWVYVGVTAMAVVLIVLAR